MKIKKRHQPVDFQSLDGEGAGITNAEAQAAAQEADEAFAIAPPPTGELAAPPQSAPPRAAASSPGKLAAATPFKTHHNALDIDVYLRISMGELWQKRLMVAGFEKTFEIGRQFRNEGMDREHLQDYSQMEFYWAYANYEDSMSLVE